MKRLNRCRLGPWRESLSLFFGLSCTLASYVIYKSTFLPTILGILLAIAGVGYSIYLWPPLAHFLYLVFGGNAERWKEQAQATGEFEAQLS